MKALNVIVLAFLPVESKINILPVNIYLNGNLFFGFCRCCGKVFPKPAVSHPLGACTHKECSLNIFFTLNFSKWQ